MLTCIGLMSGTSMDGIDATLMETDGKEYIKTGATLSISYDHNFKIKLRKAESLVRAARKDIASKEIVQESTKLHAKIVNLLLEKADLKPEDVDLIGYHGQALYHNPSAGITIQIGDGQLLSNLCNIKVINDFRSDDIKNGGQGAPLAPLYHQAIIAKMNYFPVAMVNCGGIANISLITGRENDQVIGFDTGPGNVLIDRYLRQKTCNRQFYDKDGKYGLGGIVNKIALNKLIKNLAPYLNKDFPKSLDPGDLELVKEIEDLSINDACATLENFTAYCIATSIKPNTLPKKWILAGGGWKNPVITKFLEEYLAKEIKPIIKHAHEVGLDGEYMEAEIFAYLAARSFLKLPISIPAVTGAKIPSLGGRLFIPQN
jgi:anhydro-N-acetylmuramic acid kinase